MHSVIDVLRQKNSRIHFIGIGGVSMSSLAKLLFHDGHTVSGSDANISSNTKALEQLGIKVIYKHAAENIRDFDLVVYTAAIHEDNEELRQARAKGILTVERCVLLGEMMRGYHYPVNVAGTHGKTTTTSMIASIFLDARLDPTVSVGGDFNRIEGNLNIGKKDYFICEACEYVESFLQFYPYASVILNIEADHLDYFRDIEHIKSAFLKFSDRTDENGFVLLNGDDINCRAIRPAIKHRTYTFGMREENDIYAKNVTYDREGHPSFDVIYEEKKLGRAELAIKGSHNILNALAATLCSLLLGVCFDDIAAGLNHFEGAKRRFERKGMFQGAAVYDDYAHHPTEIASTLNSISNMEYNHLYLIFQPHTYTRTKALFPEFVKVLSGVETLIITDIYAAREQNVYGISSKDLAERIEGAVYLSDFTQIVDYVSQRVGEGDLVITVGAGNVFQIGEMLLKQGTADENPSKNKITVG